MRSYISTTGGHYLVSFPDPLAFQVKQGTCLVIIIIVKAIVIMVDIKIFVNVAMIIIAIEMITTLGMKVICHQNVCRFWTCFVMFH